jgi:hypothetical protein
MVHAGGLAAGDPRIGVRSRLGLLVVRHPGQDLRQDLARLGKRRLAVRIVRSELQVGAGSPVADFTAANGWPRQVVKPQLLFRILINRHRRGAQPWGAPPPIRF